MEREGRILASLFAAGAVVLGVGGVAMAITDEKSSLTQPATELVMPFDATSGKSSFLIVSNPHASSPSGPKITTHWTFWGQDCQELADLSICLTENDTVVVDPTNMSAIGENNGTSGPTINLSGKRGLVTVTAYNTDSDCRAWDKTGRSLAINAIVGTFTIADLSSGYSFGNDALGLFSANNQVLLPDAPDTDGRYVMQALNPRGVDASLVVLGWLTVDKNGLVLPSDENRKFYSNFYDNLEVATSLPDVTVDCVDFRTIYGGSDSLIPSFVTPNSGGILALTPQKDTESEYLFAIVGQAVRTFGESSRAKVQLHGL